MNKTVNRTFSLFLLTILVALTACAPAATATAPAPLAATATAPAGVTQTLAATVPPAVTPTAVTPPQVTPSMVASSTVTLPEVTPTSAETVSADKEYSNSAFGLSFRFPASWFGPEEYISEPVLRVEIGSDTVYPYGQPPEQPSDVLNTYRIILQYTKNNQNTYWKESYDQVAKMKDGESLSGARSMLIRVRQLGIGRFQGVEFISTLSETAQTEAVYSREIILVDDQGNLLTLSGSPVNVDLSSGRQWRDAYRAIDEQNVGVFHEILESLIIQ